MRIVRRGNVYRKMGWLGEHEFQIWLILCAGVGTAELILLWTIWRMI